MKYSIKSRQLMTLASCLMLFTLMVKQGSSVAAENIQQVEDPTIQMSVERAAHQATGLKNGKVFVSGGCAQRGCEVIHRSTELFDSSHRKFSPAGDMLEPRVSHASILLNDGRVLIVGGWTGKGISRSAEIYDVKTNVFKAIANMTTARIGPVVTPLKDGRILITGGEPRPGFGLNSSELFDPDRLTFSLSGKMNASRGAHVAVALVDGRVLVTGGHSARGEILRSAEIYDPDTGKFTPTGEMTIPRHKHGGILLPDGRVLIVGGSNKQDFRGRYTSSELYDPDTGKFTSGPTMHWPRFKIRHSLVLLPSGAVLVSGGAVKNERFEPDSFTFVETGDELSKPLMFNSTSLLPSGEVLTVGGYDERIQPSKETWLIEER